MKEQRGGTLKKKHAKYDQMVSHNTQHPQINFKATRSVYTYINNNK